MKTRNLKIGPIEAYQFLVSKGYKNEAGNVYLQIIGELICTTRFQALRLADDVRHGI
jgi:hypothetical protein